MTKLGRALRDGLSSLRDRAANLRRRLASSSVNPSRKKSCCESYNGGTVWICPGPSEWSDWKPSHEAYSNVEPDEIMHPRCCVRRRRADECVTRFGFQDYYDPSPQDRCAPGKGCNANPKERAGAEGREWMVYG